MSAAEALRAARALGVDVTLDGNDLLVEAVSEPPPTTIEDLSRHRAEIIELLRPGRDGWSTEDWRLYFEERAAVAEFDGGLPRNEAEAQAFECCIVQWLDLNPASSAPGHCAWCGRSESPIVPFGTPETHTWLHRQCWTEWQKMRRSQAVGALNLMGIGNPSDGCDVSGDYTHSPSALVQDVVVVRCLHCEHEAGLSRDALGRFGLSPDSPVSAFVKRLRCRKCGSRSVTANDQPIAEQDHQKRCA